MVTPEIRAGPRTTAQAQADASQRRGTPAVIRTAHTIALGISDGHHHHHPPTPLGAHAIRQCADRAGHATNASALQPSGRTDALVNSHTVADQHDAYPRASGRCQGLRRGNQLNWRLPAGARRTVRQAARAYIVTVMSDKTGVHPVADKAVSPRITATVNLLVMPDITRSIRPDLRPTQCGARSMASGAQK